MTIEVRQILIRSIVGDEPAAAGPGISDPEWREHLRQELLAQVRALVDQRCEQQRERERER